MLTAVLTAGCFLPAVAGAASHSFATGFYDGTFAVSDPLARKAVFSAARQSGAEKALLNPGWASIAPFRPPAGFDATNPASVGYRWEALDRAVRSAAEHGLEPIILVMRAPRWAEGPARARTAELGTWRPDPEKLAEFLTAAVTRYSGAFPDPDQAGLVLPKVRHWQIWGEQNLGARLAPQWVRRGGRLVSFAPDHYRRMLRAAYQALTSLQPDAVIATGGTGPFGDLSPSSSALARMSPVNFVRDLLCRLGPDAARCRRQPALFHVLAHHPYAVGSPSRAARNPNDVTVPDLWKLTRVLRQVERAGSIGPAGRRPLWITEFSWDSSPPDPNGVPERLRARWISQALYSFWRQGAELVVWFQVRDAAPKPSYGASAQSGVFYRNGRQKLGWRSFWFPFTTERTGRRSVRYWGRAPSTGSVLIQSQQTRGWKTLAEITTGHSRLFMARLRLSGRASLRAVSAGEPSLPWAQK